MSELFQKPKLLFVDDEMNVLQGLRRLLRKMQNEWDMEFCCSGREALEKLAEEKYDAVVSDMRMPGVDGAQVLSAAAECSPESIRYILSGYAEQDSMLRAMGPAHRFFAKPCDAEKLIDELKRSLSLRQILPTESLRALVGTLDSVPVVNECYLELCRLLDDPNASSNDISEQIERDLGLHSQLLRLANSGYFALPNRVTRCRQAVDILGLETVRALSTISQFYLANNCDAASKIESQNLADRSLKIGGLSRRIAQKMDMKPIEVEEAATAGLLSHIGTAILKLSKPEEFATAMASVDEGNASLSDAERTLFGATHAELGAYLISLWGFSDTVIEAVSFHHKPSLSQHRSLSPIAAVHIAQAAVGIIDDGAGSLFPNPNLTGRFDTQYLSEIGIVDRLQECCEMIAES